ncbi:MAG TPA: hypothetical protein VFI15_01060 [Candidatus Limnocylindrales bacterium]|nr:hypothetical protein [Candidatus Limnocylindrales bacterium]
MRRANGRLQRAARAALLVSLALSAALSAAACAPAYVPRSTYPPIGSTPGPAGDATSAATQAVLTALAAAGLQATVTDRAYRPPEGPLLAAAPRTVLQVAMPLDPDHGFIVIYALESPNAALAAANDHATWAAASVGRINFPPGTRFELRVLGSNVILFSWLPGSSPDARNDQIGPALEGIGQDVAVPD